MTHRSEMLEHKALSDYVRTRLGQADLDTLRKMVDMLDGVQPAAGEPPKDEQAAEAALAETPEGEQVSRRSFVRGLATAGAAGVVLAAGGSAVAFGLGGRRTGQAVEARVNGDVVVTLVPAPIVANAQGNAVVHAPLFDRNVSPAPGVSLTVTPGASEGPLFVTRML